MSERTGKRRQFAARWLSAILITCATTVLAGAPHVVSADRDLNIRYFETSETTYTEIVVNDERLRIRYFVDTARKCAHWIEQRPCWTEAALKLAESELAPAQRNDLLCLIEQGGFMDLGPSYGGAADGQRYYPVEIAVTFGDRDRRVVYQAFPGAASMPDGFARLRARLEALAQAVLDRDTPR